MDPLNDPAKQTRAYVLSMLKLDHKRLLDYVVQFDQSNDAAHKKTIVATFLNQLALHTHLEEEIFYPYVRVKQQPIKELIDRCFTQHSTVELLVKELDLENMDEEFERNFFQLVDALKLHITYEENEIFVQLNDVDLGAIATILEIRRNELNQQEAAASNSGNVAPMSVAPADETDSGRQPQG
jgi:hemerythrin superfamily protein